METIDITDLALQKARLQGQMEAYTEAMNQCLKATTRSGDPARIRTSIDIHSEIWDLFKVAEAARLRL